MEVMMHRIVVFLLLVTLWPGIAWCGDQEQAEAMYKQGCAIQANDPQQAGQFFQQSVQAFPSYEGYYSLGKIQLQSGLYDHAAVSFKQAQSLAEGGADRAQALAYTGQTLAAMGQGREGLQAMEAAMKLHPEPPAWMKKVAHAIEDETAGTIVSANEISRCLEGAKGIGMTPRINLPVHFAYDRYDLAIQGERQVRELAKALGSMKIKDARFQVIGHTDLQGDRQYNQRLSEQRAITVVRTLEQLQPELRGLLQAIGRGMSEPRRQEMNENAHRINRRVEVIKVEG